MSMKISGSIENTMFIIERMFSMECSLTASYRGTKKLGKPKNLEQQKLAILNDIVDPITPIAVGKQQQFYL